ncbi:MAG: PRC-barrel domain-containing protein [Candidatus Thorarchaeota archaeon]
MDLCRLDNFENISEMRKKTIISSDGKKIGNIMDVVFDKDYQLHSFILGGGFWEEFRESLGIIDDIDPVLPIDNIVEISKDTIRIDLMKIQLKNKFDKDVFPENIYTYSSLKRKIIHDNDDTKIGKICNMVFLPCGEVAFILSCSHAKHLVPNGTLDKWDLLLPANEIHSINPEYIRLNFRAETLEKTLNEHIIQNEDVKKYLNSLEDKNTAKVKVISRVNLGQYMH